MPALVNISVGSPLTTIGAEGTITWPLLSKKSRKARRILFDSIYKILSDFHVCDFGLQNYTIKVKFASY